MRFDSALCSNFKPINMRLLLFILSAICMGIAVGLCSGELQNHVKFNSIESEIAMFLLCSVSGVLFLIYSVSKDENRDNRY
jgi:NhaP-type Na+/H+ and K+/H+ antiporter